MFYGTPSHYIWHSATGEADIIFQAEGGARFLVPRPTIRPPHNATKSPTRRVFARFPRGCPSCGATQRTTPWPACLKPSQHPTQPKESPCMERSWHRTTQHPREKKKTSGLATQNLPPTLQGMTVLGAPIASAAFAQRQTKPLVHPMHEVEQGLLHVHYAASSHKYLGRHALEGETTWACGITSSHDKRSGKIYQSSDLFYKQFDL